MYSEYRIEVSLTPHPWDNKEKPFFWMIAGYSIKSEHWGNTGCCGWAENPDAAIIEALIASANLEPVVRDETLDTSDSE